jgi:hypothetical protein
MRGWALTAGTILLLLGMAAFWFSIETSYRPTATVDAAAAEAEATREEAKRIEGWILAYWTHQFACRPEMRHECAKVTDPMLASAIAGWPRTLPPATQAAIDAVAEYAARVS